MLYIRRPSMTVFILAALKPSANLGTRVGGGASGATSQLTSKRFKK